jgi:hypothetical protein
MKRIIVETVWGDGYGQNKTNSWGFTLTDGDNNYYCFKYRSIDKNFVDSLITSSLYFAPREKLNDPFDCNIDVTGAVKRAMENGASEKKSLLMQFQANEIDTSRLQEGINNLGICSFSLNAENTVMWSHYSDDHKGVCIGYDFPKEFLNDEDYILGVSKVFYDQASVSSWLFDNIETYQSNHPSFMGELLKIITTSKSPHWSYEEEARILTLDAGRQSIPRTIVSKIIFGLQTSDDDIQIVKSLIDKYYTDVEFEKVYRTNNDFGIEIKGF